jgi:hypothetical protein
MPLTRAEISKRYREKQKLINLEAYREKERIRSNLYYKKIKNEVKYEDKEEEDNQNDKIKENEDKESEETKNENEDKKEGDKETIPKHLIDLNIAKIDETGFIIYKPLTKRINSLNKSKLQPQTIQLYFNSFKKVYNKFTNNEMDDKFQTELLKLLNNKPHDIDYIKDKLNFLKKDIHIFIKSLNKNELQYVYSIITRIKGFASIVKSLYPYLVQKQNEYQQSRDNVELNNIDKIKYNKLSFNKSDVINIINSEDYSLTPREKLIYGLFTLFPVRRPIDYHRMILTLTEPLNEEKKEISDRNNYYYNGVFYFYRTKNKDIQKFIVPNELDSLIKDYIKDRNNESLILSDNNKSLSNSALRIHIMKVFNKIYDISFSGVELRHYYSTYINYLVKMKQMTIEEHRKICNMMNHSYEENKKYAYLLD